MTKALVIGGSGFIGCHVVSDLCVDHSVVGTFNDNPDVRVPNTDYRQLDVTDHAAVCHLVEGVRPDVVVLVCGSQNIEVCAGLDIRQPEALRAQHVHVGGTRNVVDACLERQCRLVYVSTDCVFDGSKSFFSETDARRPFNAYGQMKRDAEEIIEAALSNYAIVRVSLTFGWRRHPRQFRNFVERIHEGLREGDGQLEAATNLFNTPIEVSAAARGIARIAVTSAVGIFHVASPDRLSRYEFACAAAEAFGFPRSRIAHCEDTTCLRPANSCLSVARTESVLGTRFEALWEGLRRMHDASPHGAAGTEGCV